MAVPAWFAGLLRDLARAVAAGVIDAWLDHLAKPRPVNAEAANASDRLRADRMRAAVNKLRSQIDPDTGPEYSPQTDPAIGPVDRDAPTRRIPGGDRDHG